MKYFYYYILRRERLVSLFDVDNVHVFLPKYWLSKLKLKIINKYGKVIAFNTVN